MPTRNEVCKKRDGDDDMDEDDYENEEDIDIDEEDDDEYKDEQRRIAEYLEFPRAASMARKSTSPLKFSLKNKFKLNNASSQEFSSASAFMSSNKKKLGRPCKNDSDTMSVASSTNANRIKSSFSTNQKRKNSSVTNNSLSSLSTLTDDTEIKEANFSFRRRNINRECNNNLGPNHEISTLGLVDSIVANELDMDFKLGSVSNNLIKNKFLEEYRSRFNKLLCGHLNAPLKRIYFLRINRNTNYLQ